MAEPWHKSLLWSRCYNPNQKTPAKKGAELTQILPVVSLFSGSGGLDEGFVLAGFSPVLAMDVDRAACLTFEHNHPGVRVLMKDLSEAVNGYAVERLSELPSAARPIGVIGGPPCQAFSLSNVHKKSDDPRLKLPGRRCRRSSLFPRCKCDSHTVCRPRSPTA